MDLTEKCVECKDVADFIAIESGWYLCYGCVKDGKAGGYGA